MEKEQELSAILTKLDFHSMSHLEAKKLILNLFSVSNCIHENTSYHKMNVKYCYNCKTIIKIDI